LDPQFILAICPVTRSSARYNFTKLRKVLSDFYYHRLNLTIFILLQINHKGTRTTAHNLVIYVEIPETSGLDVSCFSSPVVTLGRYVGLSTDVEAPEWTRIPPGIPIQLRQPRGAIAAVFAELAFWPENAAVVRTFSSFQIWRLHLIHLRSPICLQLCFVGQHQSL
jgi:hypothetical protein